MVFFDEKQTLERIRNTVMQTAWQVRGRERQILIGAEAQRPKVGRLASWTMHRIRFIPAGVWRKDWQTTLELADDGTGTLVIAGSVAMPLDGGEGAFRPQFTGWGTRTCDILDADTFVQIPEKSQKWSRIKSGQSK